MGIYLNVNEFMNFVFFSLLFLKVVMYWLGYIGVSKYRKKKIKKQRRYYV
jgi:Na+-transporting methylmalonyl-CoA/oxaloacetate decarboxylase gamma subunit